VSGALRIGLPPVEGTYRKQKSYPITMFLNNEKTSANNCVCARSHFGATFSSVLVLILYKTFTTL